MRLERGWTTSSRSLIHPTPSPRSKTGLARAGSNVKYSRRDFGLMLLALAANRLRAQGCRLQVRQQEAPTENPPALELDIRDFAVMPMTGTVNGKGEVKGLLARVNFIRE